MPAHKKRLPSFGASFGKSRVGSIVDTNKTVSRLQPYAGRLLIDLSSLFLDEKVLRAITIILQSYRLRRSALLPSNPIQNLNTPTHRFSSSVLTCLPKSYNTHR